MHDYMDQMSYTFVIYFVCNKSCLPYYLWVCFLLRSYWTYRFSFFKYILLYYFLLRFKLRFHFWNWNYYCNFFSVVTPRHLFPVSPPPLPAEWLRITGAVVYCFVLLFSIVVTSGMSVTTCFDCWFHQNYFGVTYSSVFPPEKWRFITVAGIYCCFCFFHCCHFPDDCDHSFLSLIPSEVYFSNILQSHFPIAMALYRRFRALLLFLLFSIVFTSWMSAATHFDRLFHQNYFSITYSSVFFPAQWRFTTIAVVYCYFCCFSSFSLPEWVRPLVLIANFIGITLRWHTLVNFSSAMALYHCCCGFFVVFHSCHFLDECDHSFWSPIPSEIFCGNILQCIFPIALERCHRCHGLLFFLSFFIVIASWMSVTTCFDRQFHRK